MSKDSIKCYQNNKERIFKKIYQEKYQNLSKKRRSKKQQYGREGCKNLPEDEKQKFFEYRKKYKMRKDALL